MDPKAAPPHHLKRRLSRRSKILLVLAAATTVAIAAFWYFARAPVITHAIAHADKLVLYEGLPHHRWEADLLERERASKTTVQFQDYPFYQEVIDLTPDDARLLTEILSDPATYQLFLGEKLCGGFHPDYAVEWQYGATRYHSLICFGCDEIKSSGPSVDLRNDMSDVASQRLEALLGRYRKNRPPRAP